MNRFQAACVFLLLGTVCLIALGVTATFCYITVQSELHSPKVVGP